MVENASARSLQAALIPMTGLPLLVPAALVAEVLAYRADTIGWSKFQDPPIGLMPWRGLSLPMVGLSPPMAPRGRSPAGDSAPRRVVVLFGIHHPGLPFYGVTAAANPRLVEIAEGGVRGEAADESYAVMGVALGDGRRALLPDLEQFERALADRYSAGGEPWPTVNA